MKVDRLVSIIMMLLDKKRGRRLMIAYALRGVILLLLALMIILMVCGALYIKEHLAPAPDSELPDGNMGRGHLSQKQRDAGHFEKCYE